MRMMILVLMLLSECGWLAPGRSQLHETAEAVFAEGWNYPDKIVIYAAVIVGLISLGLTAT